MIIKILLLPTKITDNNHNNTNNNNNKSNTYR